jgi:hypothetical protein
VVRVGGVEVDRPQAKDRCVEVDVALRVLGDRGDVMQSVWGDGVHQDPSGYWVISSIT